MLFFPFYIQLGFGHYIMYILGFSSFRQSGILLLHGSILMRVDYIFNLLIVWLIKVEPSRYHSMQVQNRPLYMNHCSNGYIPAGTTHLFCNLYVIL